MLTAGLVLAACGGSDSSTDAAATDSSAADTVPATEPVATDAPTTTASTAPPTTLPPTIDLNTLPGLLAVIATSCAPEPYPPHNIIENPSICTLKPNGTDVRVVSQPGESPSGLAFTRDGSHLWYGDPYTKFGYVIDLTTGEHREGQRNEPLTSGVSPDGQSVLFIGSYTLGPEIVNSDGSAFPDGSTSRSVADDPHAYYREPSWAPDSVHFAYLSTNDGNGGSTNDVNGGNLWCPDVWVGAIDGTPPVQITHFAGNADGAEGCPDSVRWSPTDDRILLHMLGIPTNFVPNLYAIDADGSHLTALTSGSPTAYVSAGRSYAGDWSPDGKYIVFIVSDGSAYQLAVMNADGSQITPIPAAPLGITSSLLSIRWSLG